MTTETASTLTPSQRFRSLAAVIASSLIAGLTYGYLTPLLALLLERQGHSQSEIGINAGAGAIATILVSFFVPLILARLGLLKAMLWSALLEIFCIAAMWFWSGLWPWTVLRFAVGLCGGVLWIAGETWIIAAARPEARGRAIALYMMALSSGFALGPLAISWIGMEGWQPFAFAVAALALSIAFVASAWGIQPRLPPSEKAVAWSALGKAPLVMAAALLAGFVDTGAFAHLAIYAERAGLDTQTAITILSVMMFANLVTQFPLGWVAERVDRRRLLIAFGFLFAAVPIGLIFFMNEPLIRWPLVVLMGAASLGIYTVALFVLGDRFPANELAGANAMIVAVYQLGSIVGPPVGGWSMDSFGNDGLMYALSTASCLFLIFAAWRSWTRSRTGG